MADYSKDPLDGTPPTGSLRTASRPPAGQLGMPSAAGGAPGAALSLTGALPAQSLASKMMMLERLVGDIARELPEAANAFAPGIQMMRDLGAAKLADKAAGGVGATNPEASAPPPGMGMPPAAPAGPGAGAGMMPPMPLNL